MPKQALLQSAEKRDIRKFSLYGQEPRKAEERFLYLEDVGTYTQPGFVARPHVHDDLCHLMVFTSGSGTLSAESWTAPFAGLCMVLIPSRVIHAFRFDTKCIGMSLTFADSLIRDLSQSEPAFEDLFLTPSVIPISNDSGPAKYLTSALRIMASELRYSKKGYRAVIDSCLIGLLVVALRSIEISEKVERVTRGPDTELVARFRALMDEGIRSHMTMPQYAAALGVSTTRLRNACIKVTRKPPMQLIQQRMLLESKRLLLYSSKKTIAEIAYAVGFEDPAYFSRFFMRREGECPTAFRNRRAPV